MHAADVDPRVIRNDAARALACHTWPGMNMIRTAAAASAHGVSTAPGVMTTTAVCGCMHTEVRFARDPGDERTYIDGDDR